MHDLRVISARCVVLMIAGLLSLSVSAQDPVYDSHLSRFRSAPDAGVKVGTSYSGQTGAVSSRFKVERPDPAGSSGWSARHTGARAGKPAPSTSPFSSRRGPHASSRRSAERPTAIVRPGSVRSTSQRIGNLHFYQFSDGLTASSSKVGDVTFYRFSDGNSGHMRQIEDVSYRHDSRGDISTSRRIGNMMFHREADGLTGTSRKIDDTVFHHFSDGVRCMTRAIGSQTWTDCH